VQFYNNLFVSRGNASQYSRALLPVIFNGDVYTKGSIMATPGKDIRLEYPEVKNERAREQLSRYTEQDAMIRNTLEAMDFDAAVSFSQSDEAAFLEIALDMNWLTQKRELVVTDILLNAPIAELPYVNPDDSPIIINTDYYGNKRNSDNPSPGPFEITKSGKQTFQVWPAFGILPGKIR